MHKQHKLNATFIWSFVCHKEVWCLSDKSFFPKMTQKDMECVCSLFHQRKLRHKSKSTHRRKKPTSYYRICLHQLNYRCLIRKTLHLYELIRVYYIFYVKRDCIGVGNNNSIFMTCDFVYGILQMNLFRTNGILSRSWIQKKCIPVRFILLSLNNPQNVRENIDAITDWFFNLFNMLNPLDTGRTLNVYKIYRKRPKLL